ncbi:MAG: flagellar motor switch protein FliG, partial [Pseudomonadota bacterium]|nr:flagellar motor switch protein FliG [Pseudomonadota bacterium]
MAEAANKLPAVQDEAAAIAEARFEYRKLDGPEKAAILLLALGAEYGNAIWKELDDNEVIAISLAMSRLGTVTKELTETLMTEFVSQMSLAGALMGTALSTERLLSEYLPPDRLKHIMEEIRGPAGRNMWEKLSNVQANVLANYLKNEYPQTVAVVLSKISTEHAARVLSILPEDFAMEVVHRLLGMESVQRDVLEKIEHTLRSEFISNLSQTQKRDAHELMAEIFNNFDRQTESRFLTSLEEDDWDAAERIKHLMFTFDDLA